MATPSPTPQALPRQSEPLSRATAIGAASDAHLGIYISREVVAFIDNYVRANPNKKSGGILVGYAAQSEHRPFLRIIGAIEAPEIEVVNDGVHFTDAAWRYMADVCAREYPGTSRLGWFVCNPGHGARLSSNDQFTHHRFFDRPWQVSFVVDPLREASRFYGWDGDRLSPIDAFYVWDPEPSQAPITPDAATPPVPPATRRPRRGAVWLGPALVLLIGCVLLSMSLPRIAAYLPGIGPLLRQADYALQEVHAGLEHAARTNEALIEAMSVHAARSSAQSDSQVGLAEEAVGTAPTPSESGSPEPITEPPPSRNDTIATLREPGYIVREGDTLWDISRSLLGDPMAYPLLAEWNEIPDPDSIRPGLPLRVLQPRNKEEAP